MKRTTVQAALVPACLVLAASLTACGSDANSPASSGAKATGSTTTNGSSTDCPTGTINGEGSSAQKNAIELAITAYQDTCSGATVNYNPTGSGAGIKQFIAKQVDFAGSDSALKTVAVDGVVEADAAAKTCGSPAWDIPMVAGPIAIAYNLPGVTTLTLNAEVAAKIFNGTITTWNDPAIAALNAGASLPATAIKVFFRSDESGTTENFTKYLHAAAPAVWTADPSKKWTGKGEGKEKSAGVASAAAATPGGVTYAEWSYATQNKLGVAQIDSGAGAVALTGESAGKAVAAASQKGQGNDLALSLKYDTKEAGVYPIILVTYEIVCSTYADKAKANGVKSFLKFFASPEVQSKLESAGYAPLPAAVQAKVAAAIAAIS
ncbi:MAG TPA: phosphate ABC transporter substrate-binding protein PstS [Dermatophilaceae bacterium]|nr:phosphate ABC transporter substrate-binding protein PstS [Dermatophilaceae bacterium]